MASKTKYYSYLSGNLPEGCRWCVQGRKTVLFITGLCPAKCFYCPVSDLKLNRDVTYANERPVQRVREVMEEAKLCSSRGAGITGGDPLIRLGRTLHYIRTLKREFGRDFHIHLYTPLNLVTPDALKKLYTAGLDEIRFHPNLDDNKLWSRIRAAAELDWDFGVEIPAIPGKEENTKQLIDFVAGTVKFLNLNELEISDSSANQLVERGFQPKDRMSYGVKGSHPMALKMLKYAQTRIDNVHYCTTTLKDRVQLANRIKRRARNVAGKFDRVTREGMLVRGAVYLPELKPGFGYRRKLAEVGDWSRILGRLNQVRKRLMRKYHLPGELIRVDHGKLRLLTSEKMANKIKSPELCTAIVTEYPTHDQFEVEVKLLD